MEKNKQFAIPELFSKVPLKGSHIVKKSKLGLVLPPTVTLKVLVNIRLGQKVPFSCITNLNFLNFSQKRHLRVSRW